MKTDTELLDWLEKNLDHIGIGTPKDSDKQWWIFFNEETDDCSGPTLRQAIAKAMEN